MFEAKKAEKLHPTDLKAYQNKLRLEELETFDPFEIIDSDGLRIFKNPNFEPYFKIIQSLRVTDNNDTFLPRQTQSLKENILKTARQETFLELVYLKTLPEKERYVSLLEEKLYIILVNLVLEDELPLDRTLTPFEIEKAEKAFKNMLENV